MLTRLIIATILILSIPKLGYGQNNRVYWNYDISHGLPTNSIYHVFVDSKDRVWFGSDKGVTKFDGNTFTTYTVKDGLSDNTVIRCYEDSRGRIWFHHIEQLPSYYKNGVITALNKKNKEFPVDPMSNLVEFNDEFFFGGIGGLISIDQADQVTIYKSKKHVAFVTHFEDQNRLFLSSSESIGNHKFKNNPNLEIENIYTFQTEFNYGIDQKIDGTAINRSREFKKKIALSEINSNQLRMLNFPTGKIYNIEFLGSRIFVASANGLFEFTFEKGVLSHKTSLLVGIPISGVAFDSDGNIWANSIKNGLYFFSAKVSSFHSYPKGRRLLGITNSTEGLWLNGESKFMEHFSADKFDMRDLPNLNLKRARTILDYFENKDFKLYVTLQGIGITHKKNNKSYHVKPNVTLTSCFPKTKNDFYFAGSTGIVRIKLGKKGIEKHEKWLFDIGRIKQVSFLNNSLVLGTHHGLYLSTNGKLTPYHSKVLKKSRINSLFKIKNTLLIGTSDKGLFLDKNGILNSLNESAGLLSNSVRKIYESEEKNCVWVHSDLGLQKFKLVNDRLVELMKIDLRTPFKIDEISDLLELNGELILVLNTGIRIIRIGEFGKVKSLNILIESVKLGETELSIEKTKQISTKEQNIRFNLTAVNHSAHTLSYYYKINKERWVKNETNQFSFSSLSPGKYEIEVKVTSPFHKTAFISPLFITIQKEWYQETYLKILVFVTSLLIISLFLRWRINKTQSHKRKVISNELLALQSQMNPHFTFNSLNSIQSYLSTNDKRSAQIYLADFAILIRKILDQAKISLIPIEEEIDFLTQYLNLEKRRLNNSFDYSITVDQEINQQTQGIPTLMVQPFVENAIWHGVAALDYPGQIDIMFVKNEDSIICTILDNGHGLKNKKYESPFHKSMGITNCKERMDLFKELQKKEMTLDIKDRKENNLNGVCVQLIIPNISID